MNQKVFQDHFSVNLFLIIQITVLYLIKNQRLSNPSLFQISKSLGLTKPGISIAVWNPFSKSNFFSLKSSVNTLRHGGWCKILGVLMSFAANYTWNLKILGLITATFFFISTNIGGAAIEIRERQVLPTLTYL